MLATRGLRMPAARAIVIARYYARCYADKEHGATMSAICEASDAAMRYAMILR